MWRHGKRPPWAAGLAALALAAAGAGLYVKHGDAGACWVCAREFRPGLPVRMRVAWLGWRSVCCAGCAVRYARTRPGRVRDLRVTDYATGRGLRAEAAFYVVGSDVRPCHRPDALRVEPGVALPLTWDRCIPSHAAFSDRVSAEDFARAHGGRTASWAELTACRPIR
ncbi:MAG: hypothetical protein PHF00_05385 [Elusimicrobia bacterium]|nr:hypothetical protein [Elusimicrobiota bacterium]